MSGAAAVLYSSVGNELTRYEIDPDEATLTRRETVRLPANVQYVWPHPSKRYLYVASSPRGPGGKPGNDHHLTAFRIDPQTGALQQHGAATLLPHRPIHMSLDRSGKFALIAYSEPSALTVHRLNEDGTIGAQVEQPSDLDTGIYAHQILAAPSNRTTILVTRGHDATAAKAEDPGALKVFDFNDGVLSNRASIAPGGGFGFGPRHIDFHPTKPWVYVSLERQNRLQLFTLEGDAPSAAPLFTKELLENPQDKHPRQLGSTVHVHPNGRFVYVANRADHEVEHEGKRVFGGGENSIAVFAIDPATGEPTLIQHIDPQSVHVRTFAFDPSGRVMVAASIKSIDVREGATLRNVPAALSVFRVGEDGKLTFVRKYDVETGGRYQFWMGIVGLR
jgi:6-phosphogluconolactonase